MIPKSGDRFSGKIMRGKSEAQSFLTSLSLIS
jgi:hypothetical protein